MDTAPVNKQTNGLGLQSRILVDLEIFIGATFTGTTFIGTTFIGITFIGTTIIGKTC